MKKGEGVGEKDEERRNEGMKDGGAKELKVKE